MAKKVILEKLISDNKKNALKLSAAEKKFILKTIRKGKIQKS